MSIIRQIAVAITAITVSGLANASFVGDSVQCGVEVGFLTGCGPTSSVVGSGNEFRVGTVAPGYSYDVDIGASSLKLTMNGAGLSGWIGQIYLTGLDWVGTPATITGISNFATTADYGMSLSDISFSRNSLAIDLHNSGWSGGDTLSFDIQTSATKIPEPASLGLVGLGLAVLGFSRRRRVAKSS